LNTHDKNLIRAISSFEEYGFIHGMALLEDLPADEKRFTVWCRQWEQLISLPLDSPMISWMIRHFVNLREKLKAENDSMTKSYLFEDIKLQVLRRAKAEAEIRLKRVSLPDPEKQKFVARLQRADIEHMHELLQSLNCRT